jgi:hypothetical protein
MIWTEESSVAHHCYNWVADKRTGPVFSLSISHENITNNSFHESNCNYRRCTVINEMPDDVKRILENYTR